MDKKYLSYTFNDNDTIDFQINGKFSLLDFYMIKEHLDEFIEREMKKVKPKKDDKEELIELLMELFK